ncbi:MAG: hypothetical protein ACLQVJ_18850 [Syntrophobacteraceae bacterium]
MKSKIGILAILMLGLIFVGPAYVQAQASATVTMTATVNSYAVLTVGGGATTAISFPNADPATVPNIAANVTVPVVANFRTSGTATLTAQGTTDATGLKGVTPTNKIPWGNITFACTGANPIFANCATTPIALVGSSATPAAVGSATQSGAFNDTFTYSMLNNYTYNTDTYTGTVTYTLTAP